MMDRACKQISLVSNSLPQNAGGALYRDGWDWLLTNYLQTISLDRPKARV